MSEVTDLVVIEKQNAMAVFTTKEQLDPIIEQIEKEARSLVPDVSTRKGRDAIASMAHKVARSKTYIDNAGKDLVAELKALPKQIDESRRVVRERLDALKDEVRRPLNEWEAEQERIKAEEAMTALHVEALEMNARFDQELAARFEADHELALLENYKFDREREEQRRQAEQAQRERDEQLQREAAEKAQREAEERHRADIEAAARREAEVKARAEAAERQRIEAEQRAQREAEEARLRAEREKQAAICLDISYMGLMHIAQQSGAIKWCQSAIVRKNDQFRREGLDKPPIHIYNDFDTAEQRGDIVGAYVVIKTDDGDYLTHTMRIDAIYSIRDRSEAWKKYKSDNSKKCPWVTDEEQMILKTVVKQAAKYWPRRERLDAAIDHVNTEGEEGINFAAERQPERDITPLA